MSFEIVVTILGIMMSMAYFPQAFKIWKNKSSKDVSITSYVVFSLGTLVWTIYGIHVNDPVIILSFGVGVIGSWSVLSLSIFYKNR